MEKGKIKVAILTVSTSCFKGERKDRSGEVLMRQCKKAGFVVAKKDIVSDRKSEIKKFLKGYLRERINLVLTTGGTGLGPFDVTPEATLEIGGRNVPGISEFIRIKGVEKTKTSILSRGVCVLKGKTLIINLPGSTSGARDSFKAVLPVLEHAFHIIKGGGHD
ncbi:MAG: MogA/MoaB family molybdenum cofactor biosynthesis protein [Elusimicrobia bacterium]|nr:MogA/MoaB family molybdenum cofactor biosynthesis protein [Elusimicrobiota bacterium]